MPKLKLTRLQPTRPLGFLPSRLLLVLPLLLSIYFQYDLVGYYFIFQAQKRDLYSSTPTLSLVGPRRLTIWSGSLPSTDYIPSPYYFVTVLAILPFDFPVFRDLCWNAKPLTLLWYEVWTMSSFLTLESGLLIFLLARHCICYKTCQRTPPI